MAGLRSCILLFQTIALAILCAHCGGGSTGADSACPDAPVPAAPQFTCNAVPAGANGCAGVTGLPFGYSWDAGDQRFPLGCVATWAVINPASACQPALTCACVANGGGSRWDCPDAF